MNDDTITAYVWLAAMVPLVLMIVAVDIYLLVTLAKAIFGEGV